jgi:hypothetical protein
MPDEPTQPPASPQPERPVLPELTVGQYGVSSGGGSWEAIRRSYFGEINPRYLIELAVKNKDAPYLHELGRRMRAAVIRATGDFHESAEDIWENTFPQAVRDISGLDLTDAQAMEVLGVSEGIRQQDVSAFAAKLASADLTPEQQEIIKGLRGDIPLGPPATPLRPVAGGPAPSQPQMPEPPQPPGPEMPSSGLPEVPSPPPPTPPTPITAGGGGPAAQETPATPQPEPPAPAGAGGGAPAGGAGQQPTGQPSNQQSGGQQQGGGQQPAFVIGVEKGNDPNTQMATGQ